MKRILILRLSAVLLLFLTNAVLTHCQADDRPNVIFILCDDLGWRDVGCFGSTYHKTPNIDQLASRGIRLTQAYAASPLCSPTRSSILTGLYPARIGITSPSCHLPAVQLEKRLTPNPGTNVKVVPADSLTRLKPDYVTLAERFRDSGYTTAHFGKWHLGHSGPYEPQDQGFDSDFPHTPTAAGPGGGYLAPWKFIQDKSIEGTPGEHIEDRMSEEAAKFIRTNRDRPFFLNYWAYSVHSPWNARTDYINEFSATADPSNPQHNPLYAAMVRSLDDGVGRLLNAVDEAGLTQKTLFIFFSDNGGWAYPPKATIPEGYADIPATSNAPLRSGKASLYEGGTREPCIVVWPGKIPAGKEVSGLFQSTDFAPTLIQLCGLASPDQPKFDGMDQSELWLNGTTKRDFVFCHFPHGSEAQAKSIPGFMPGSSLRKGSWKLIRFYAQNEDGSDLLELYNLATDPGETTNVASDYPDQVRSLLDQMNQILSDTEAVIPVRNPDFQPNSSATPQKNAPKNSPKKNADESPTELQGWKARGCTATVTDGLLTVTPQNGAPFLGFAAGRTKGPATVQLRVRAKNGGTAKIEWLPEPAAQKQAQSVEYTLIGGEWQMPEIKLPAQGQLGILRVYLPVPNEAVELDWIKLDAETGNRTWDF